MNVKEYIQGQRHGKKANRLERQAMEDPFLQDAIDGFDSVEGDHLSVIEKLEKHVSPARKRISRSLWIWAAAALLVLLIGIPLLLLPPGTKEEITVASSEIIQQTKEITPTAAPQDSVLVADHSGQPPVIDKAKTESNDKFVEIMVNEETERATIPPDVTTKSNFTGSKDNGEQLLARGRVVDETGEPIIGATIQLRNSNVGSVTDMDGRFSLNVPANADSTLLASFIGMKPQEIPVKENVGDITLQSDDMALDEIVVVAFGTQKKEHIVGSVAKVDSVAKKGFYGGSDSVATDIDRPFFGNDAFTVYFRENYDKTICAGEEIIFVVKFHLDSTGRPGNIRIQENSCPAMETEIKRLLLGSPLWSEGNREVTLKIKL